MLTENLLSSRSSGSRGKFSRFLTANADEGDLKQLWESIGHALQRFQVGHPTKIVVYIILTI